MKWSSACDVIEDLNAPREALEARAIHPRMKRGPDDALAQIWAEPFR